MFCFVDAAFFYWDFVGDISLAHSLSHLIFGGSLCLTILVILLWIFAFLSQMLIGLVVLREGRDRLFCSRLEQLGRYRLWLYDCAILVLAPLILIFQHAREVTRIQLKEKAFSKICQSSSQMTDSQLEEAVSLHRDHEQHVSRRCMLGRLLAASYRNYMLWEAYPQILCQLAIVWLADIPFPYPGAVTSLASRLDIWPEVIFMFYLSAMWSIKLASCTLLTRTPATWAVKLQMYTIKLGRAGPLVYFLYLFWVPQPGLSCQYNPYQSDFCLALADKYGPVGKSDIPASCFRNYLNHLLFFYLRLLAFGEELLDILARAWQSNTSLVDRLQIIATRLRNTAGSILLFKGLPLRKQTDFSNNVFGICAASASMLLWFWYTFEPLYSLPDHDWQIWYLFYLNQPGFLYLLSVVLAACSVVFKLRKSQHHQLIRSIQRCANQGKIMEGIELGLSFVLDSPKERLKQD